MGTIQIALSATEFRKSLDPRLLLAFISGCWVNASLFIVGGVSEKGRGIFGNPHVQRITLLSFLVNTVSWSYMTVKAIKEALGSGSSE